MPCFVSAWTDHRQRRGAAAADDVGDTVNSVKLVNRIELVTVVDATVDMLVDAVGNDDVEGRKAVTRGTIGKSFPLIGCFSRFLDK